MAALARPPAPGVRRRVTNRGNRLRVSAWLAPETAKPVGSTTAMMVLACGSQAQSDEIVLLRAP